MLTKQGDCMTEFYVYFPVLFTVIPVAQEFLDKNIMNGAEFQNGDIPKYLHENDDLNIKFRYKRF